MKFEKKMAAGILTCFLIAIPAWALGKFIPIIGGPVFGILFGMILAFIKRPEKLESGIKYTSKAILQYSIILLGFEMNLFNVLKVGGQSLMVMVFTLSSSFITAYLVYTAVRCRRAGTVRTPPCRPGPSAQAP